jgi:acetyl-CoA acetyltransferase
VADSAKSEYEVPYGIYGAPCLFAPVAARYEYEHGSAVREAMAAFAMSMRTNAAMTKGAQTVAPLSRTDYERSPFVAYPLRVVDCCILTDGAVATIITAASVARDLRQPAVYIRGSGSASSGVSSDDLFTQGSALFGLDCPARAVKRALLMADIELSDVDFMELYDCFTITAVFQVEAIGLCKRGDGANYLLSSQQFGGTASCPPINTHGGLLAHSYLLGATHVTEAVRQLRHQSGAGQVPNASLGLVGLFSSASYSALLLSTSYS